MSDIRSRVGTIPKLEFVDGRAVMVTKPVTAEDYTGGSLNFLMRAGFHNINQLQDISNNYQERMKNKK